MTNDQPIHHRKSIRLPGYDYTLAGAYFITLVNWRRECLFGEITGNFQKDGTPEMRLDPYGEILSRVWLWMNLSSCPIICTASFSSKIPFVGETHRVAR